MNGTQIEFLHLARPYAFVHLAQCGGVFGCNDYSAGVAVYAVAEGRRKGLLRCGIVFAFLTKICPQVHEKGVVSALVILMHEDARTLIYKNDVFILKNDAKFRLYAPQRAAVVLRRAEKFIADEKLYLIALGKHCVRLGTPAVQLYFFGPYRLVHKGLRHSLHRFGEELIKPLSRVVFAYCENFHCLRKQANKNVRLS